MKAITMRYLIGRYHEIALKGRNQWRFVDQLKSNLRAVFADYKLGAMRGEGPRLIVELPDEIDEQIAAERAGLLFGLQNFSLSRAVARVTSFSPLPRSEHMDRPTYWAVRPICGNTAATLLPPMPSLFRTPTASTDVCSTRFRTW